eukprot:scaffold325058_cov24-Attheya_sp.AAC.1
MEVFSHSQTLKNTDPAPLNIQPDATIKVTACCILNGDLQFTHCVHNMACLRLCCIESSHD